MSTPRSSRTGRALSTTRWASSVRLTIERERLHRDGYALLRGAIPADWLPALREAFLTWLAADNFAEGGSQRLRLSRLTEPLLVQQDNGFLGA